jgi:arsenate reductase (glutaredoxin)
MKKIIIYHNPRCSKSRQALSLLENNGFQPEIIEYLKNPPTIEEIKHLIRLLAIEPRELMRKNEAVYKKMHLANPSLMPEELISILSEYPILIERPIVIMNNTAIIARPPEKILEII